MATLRQIKNELEKVTARSAWDKGVLSYAWELYENIEQNEMYSGMHDTDYEYTALEKIMLNGAQNWNEYSYGGCSYIYDADIAQALCTLTELKHTDNGNKQPNRSETWLDVQARALKQACHLIKGIAVKIDRKN